MTQATEYLVGFSAGASACMYIYRQVHTLVREAKHGVDKIRTFAQDPEHYWSAMRENVTDPLADILKEQVRSNHQVMLKLVQLEERTRVRH